MRSGSKKSVPWYIYYTTIALVYLQYHHSPSIFTVAVPWCICCSPVALVFLLYHHCPSIFTMPPTDSLLLLLLKFHLPSQPHTALVYLLCHPQKRQLSFEERLSIECVLYGERPWSVSALVYLLYRVTEMRLFRTCHPQTHVTCHTHTHTHTHTFSKVRAHLLNKNHSIYRAILTTLRICYRIAAQGPEKKNKFWKISAPGIFSISSHYPGDV